MSSTSNVLLVGALFCVLMLLVVSSLLRSGFAGIHEWCIGNVLGGVALVLYAYGRELPPIVAYEVANGMYAAASAAMLAGYRRFLGDAISKFWLTAAVGLLVAAIAVFHYWFDSFALRTTVVSLFQVGVGLAIIRALFSSSHLWRSRYPFYFAVAMAAVVALGHTVRSMIYLARTGEVTSLLQPTGWNLFFVSAGTFVLPVLTIAAVMLVHDAMMARAEHAANRDFLTGAWSRRAFFELAERELARARRSGRTLSLLLLDVDRFKQINDTWGHAVGDQVLQQVVSAAGPAIRTMDFFARVGGEEFVVLLPETEGAAALLAAERLCMSLDRDASVTTAKGKPLTLHFTVSGGLATWRRGEDLQDLMRRADAALYQAKHAGRNRIMVATGEMPACEPEAERDSVH